MFFLKSLKMIVPRRHKMVAGFDSLEDRQMLTRGFLPSLPPTGPAVDIPRPSQWQSSGPPGITLGDGVRGAHSALGGSTGGPRDQNPGMVFGGVMQGRGRSFPGQRGGPAFGGRSQGMGQFGRPSPINSIPSAVAGSSTVASSDGVPTPTPTGAPIQTTGQPIDGPSPASPEFTTPGFEAPRAHEPMGWETPRNAVDPSSTIDLANEGVRTAAEELRNAVDPIFAAKRPTHASMGALWDDLEAIQEGTLAGEDATAKIKADETAILASAGASQTDIEDVLAKADALRAAVDDAGGDSTALTILGPGGPHLDGPAAGATPGPRGGPFGPGAGQRMGPPFGGFAESAMGGPRGGY